MNIILIVVVVMGVFIIGGGLGVLFYYRTRPKQETWIAYVYGVGEGVKEISKDKDGNVINTFKLQDLIPYKKDVLVKLNKAHAVTIYKLSALGHTTQQPSPDSVDVWGNGERIVKVLLVGNNATILKKGYDNVSGNAIFRPMPRETLEMVISEAETKTDDLEESKNFLQQALPWIGVGIMFGSLIAVSYFNAQGIIMASQNNEEGAKYLADTVSRSTEAFREDLKGIRSSLPQNTENNKYGKQPNNQTKQEETIK